MKKIYSFFTLLFACMIALPAFAQTTVVTKIGDPIKDMNTLKVGDKVLLYCNGPVDPADKEYGTRNAFLCEADGKDVNISRNLREGALNSSDYLWEIIKFEVGADTAIIQFKSPRGNYLPDFIDDEETYGEWARWMGRTVETLDSVGTYVMSIAGDVKEADSLFYFQDKNGVFFNGQNLPKGATTGTANFVGWNTVGGNSLYMVYKPVIEEKTTYKFEFNLKDTDDNPKEENGSVTIVALDGDTLQAPAWEHATFHHGIAENGDDFSFPYVVDAEKDQTENFVTLYYDPWTLVHFACVDADDENVVLLDAENYYPTNAKVAIPTAEQVGLGYKLVLPEEYVGKDSITVVENDEKYLDFMFLYKRGNEGVPFKTTTVTDGQFPENTTWYIMHIRGNRALSYADSTEAVGCAPTEDYTDAHLWAFEGDLVNGFKIYNKAAGAEKILWAADGNDGTQVLMTPIADTEGTENTFELNYNNANGAKGFGFKLHGTDYSYLNEYGGEDGDHTLKFWTNENAKTDGGSRIKFMEYDEEWANALRMAKFTTYVNAENCVGGWTADKLVDLKAAIAAQDVTACETAVEALQEADTIAFDMNKAYAFVSANKGFIINQPGKSYAMVLRADQSLGWKELNVADKAFHFGFNVASDSTNYIIPIAAKLPLASFRYDSENPVPVKCTEWGVEADTAGVYALNAAAPFKIEKSDVAPAAYRFVHRWNPKTDVTLAAFADVPGAGRDKVSNTTATEGFVASYNTSAVEFNNYWRMLPVGELTGIEDTVVANPGAQEEVIFDLSGRRVQKAVKGLYIVNGKKVYVK